VPGGIPRLAAVTTTYCLPLALALNVIGTVVAGFRRVIRHRTYEVGGSLVGPTAISAQAHLIRQIQPTSSQKYM
jgi:hypothetical protein